MSFAGSSLLPSNLHNNRASSTLSSGLRLLAALMFEAEVANDVVDEEDDDDPNGISTTY
jgi:hypothetical protein